MKQHLFRTVVVVPLLAFLACSTQPTGPTGGTEVTAHVSQAFEGTQCTKPGETNCWYDYTDANFTTFDFGAGFLCAVNLPMGTNQSITCWDAKLPNKELIPGAMTPIPVPVRSIAVAGPTVSPLAAGPIATILALGTDGIVYESSGVVDGNVSDFYAPGNFPPFQPVIQPGDFSFTKIVALPRLGLTTGGGGTANWYVLGLGTDQQIYVAGIGGGPWAPATDLPPFNQLTPPQSWQDISHDTWHGGATLLSTSGNLVQIGAGSVSTTGHVTYDAPNWLPQLPKELSPIAVGGAFVITNAGYVGGNTNPYQASVGVAWADDDDRFYQWTGTTWAPLPHGMPVPPLAGDDNYPGPTVSVASVTPLDVAPYQQIVDASGYHHNQSEFGVWNFHARMRSWIACPHATPGTDTSDDPANCGKCGTACPGGGGVLPRACVSGSCCTHAAVDTDCSKMNGICIDLYTDVFNCGGCGNQCPTGQGCFGGSCRPSVITMTMVNPDRSQETTLIAEAVAPGNLQETINGTLNVVQGIQFIGLPFTFPDLFVEYAGESGARPVSGDFNGDGAVDIGLVGAGAIPITWALGTNGGLTNLGVTGGECLPGRFLVGCLQSRVAGDSNFLSYARLAGAKPVVGDFNGDGKADIALTAGQGWTTIPVAYSYGNGGFYGTNVGVTIGYTGFSADAAKLGIPVPGDFDGDGLGDIAMIGSTSNLGTIPIAYATGDGHFRATHGKLTSGDLGFTAYAILPGAKPVPGDFNADGCADIALTGGSGWTTIPVAFSNCDGTFAGVNLPPDPGGPDTGFPWYATLPGATPVPGDFNADGCADIALTGGLNWTTIPVVFGSCDMTNFAPSGVQYPFYGTNHQTLPFEPPPSFPALASALAATLDGSSPPAAPKAGTEFVNFQ
jgi:hypothetical protein